MIEEFKKIFKDMYLYVKDNFWLFLSIIILNLPLVIMALFLILGK